MFRVLLLYPHFLPILAAMRKVCNKFIVLYALMRDDNALDRFERPPQGTVCTTAFLVQLFILPFNLSTG